LNDTVRSMEKTIILYKPDEYGNEVRVVKQESELDEQERVQVLNELIQKFNNSPTYTQIDFLRLINEQIKYELEIKS
jgi:hypothetical protein